MCYTTIKGGVGVPEKAMRVEKSISPPRSCDE